MPINEKKERQRMKAGKGKRRGGREDGREPETEHFRGEKVRG